MHCETQAAQLPELCGWAAKLATHLCNCFDNLGSVAPMHTYSGGLICHQRTDQGLHWAFPQSARHGTACTQHASGVQVLSHSRAVVANSDGTKQKYVASVAVAKRLASRWPKPKWHAPWQVYRVISGHLGWVRSIAFDPGNEWFVTGSGDRTIKVWDTASGNLKLTLTGHIEQVTGLAVSDKHPYMFSCGLDKKVMCWDLEHNKARSPADLALRAQCHACH